jgi:hypothetical protein
MWKVKREGTPEQYAAHVQVLKLLDEAQRLLDAATSPLTSNTRGTE